MKTIIILITLVPIFEILTLYSCGTSKGRFRQEKSYEQLANTSEISRQQQYLIKDANHRYWSIFTDSIFYFHPDSGLWADGGYMRFEDKIVADRYYQESANHKDSLFRIIAQSEIEEMKWWKSHSMWSVYMGAIIIFGIGITIFTRKLR